MGIMALRIRTYEQKKRVNSMNDYVEELLEQLAQDRDDEVEDAQEM